MYKARSLIEAIKNKDVTTVKQLVKEGADVNGQDLYHQKVTPLHQAAKSGNVVILAFLIEQGAAVNARNDCEKTPLHEAARFSNVATIEFLIKQGADVNAQDQYGSMPLHYSVEFENVAIIEFLIASGANVNVQNHYGATPLHKAVRHGRSALVTSLIAQGADINARDKTKQTPLHMAARNNNEKILTCLIAKGALLNAQDKNQVGPLYTAICFNKVLNVQLLLRNGAYGYRDSATEKALHAWKPKGSWNEGNIVDGITMLVAGVDLNWTALPKRLDFVQDSLEKTVAQWLSALTLSQDEMRSATPSVLRILPRILHLTKMIKKEDSFYIDPGYNIDKIRQCFFVLEETVTPRLEVLKKLYAKRLPVELIMIIREYLVDRAMVETLMQFYSLEPFIVNYLWRNCKIHWTKYKLFHTELFQHPWEEENVPLPHL